LRFFVNSGAKTEGIPVEKRRKNGMNRFSTGNDGKNAAFQAIHLIFL